MMATVMAFGSGVLISTLAFELMPGAFKRGGRAASGTGFLLGALIYTAANLALDRHGGRYRSRSGFHPKFRQATAKEAPDSGAAIAIGALLDGIPESMVIGVSLLAGGQVGMVAVIAIFISNLPEGLSSSAGMKRAGRSRRYIFGVWGGIALLSGLAAMAGCVLFRQASGGALAMTDAVAAGAMLTMIVNTMIPEAFSETHEFTGLVAVLGFLLAFFLSMSS